MSDALGHKGPNYAGVWVSLQAHVALAHRRLAIVDLSAAGHQPMASASGRCVIAFNGEIYNHLELRSALASAVPTWSWHSDTETPLAGIEHWGLVPTLQRSVACLPLPWGIGTPAPCT
jgi:asparagine synthase (glutamine-hydrolysing)